MIIPAATSAKLREFRTSVPAVTYVKGRVEDHYRNELQLSSLEVTTALTKIFARSVDKRFLIR